MLAISTPAASLRDPTGLRELVGMVRPLSLDPYLEYSPGDGSSGHASRLDDTRHRGSHASTFLDRVGFTGLETAGE
jgi:hypothetical protein